MRFVHGICVVKCFDFREHFASVTATEHFVSGRFLLVGGMKIIESSNSANVDPNTSKRMNRLKEEIEIVEVQLEAAMARLLFDPSCDQSRDSVKDNKSAPSCSDFDEDLDDDELIRRLFDEIDQYSNGHLSIDKLRVFASKKRSDDATLNELLKALECAITDSENESVDYEIFCRTFKGIPRVRGQRIKWARSLRLDAELARFLPIGDISDGLKGLKGLNEMQKNRLAYELSAKFTARVPEIILAGLLALETHERLDAKEFVNNKFCLDGSYVGKFAALQDFHDGPEKKIGTPNPLVEEGIQREHCLRSNSRKKFISTNYMVETYPALEWEFVVEPRDNVDYPHTPKDKSQWKMPYGKDWLGDHGREYVMLEKIMKLPEVAEAELKRGECIALRLYTGPNFNLYNAVLRRFPVDVYSSLEGNNYETTIFCIISGIAKLSKSTALPPDRRVYRGLGGMILPEQFWGATGFRGGIEPGLMSTTTNREIAVQYSGMRENRGTVFEIIVGRIDIGADLSWISQYPGEKEILFPPLTCLEVIDEPRVEGNIIVFPLRANMNLKCLTLEQLEERRKLLHLAMTKNLREELQILCSSRFLELQVFCDM